MRAIGGLPQWINPSASIREMPWRCPSACADGLLIIVALAPALAAGFLVAQQPVQPLPKVGSCPLGYYSSGSYCVPSSGGNSRGAIEMSGSCPLGFNSSGNYCVSSPSNNREAIQKTGNSCPLGYYGSGSYCVKSR